MTPFASALHNALNSRLLLFQHAHPEIPVAAMHQGQALDVALGLELDNGPRDLFTRAVYFVAIASRPQDLSQEHPEVVIRARGLIRTNGSLVRTADEAMIQGVLKIYEEPLKKVLERFQAAEPVRKDPNDEGAWQVYGDWLLEQGDPRGELIMLEHAIDETKRAEEYLAREIQDRKEFLLKTEIEMRLPAGFDHKRRDANICRGSYLLGFRAPSVMRTKLSRLFASEKARFLTSLHLTSFASVVACLQYPQLSSIRNLFFSALRSANDKVVTALIKSPHLKSLRSLTFQGGRRLGDQTERRLRIWARERGIELTL